MSESRIDATDRLRREGRWEAASKFRDDKRRELRGAGKRRTEANDLAWDVMISEFSPLPTPEPTDDAGEVSRKDAAKIAVIMGRPEHRAPRALDDATWVYDHVGDETLTPDAFPNLGAWSLWSWARANRARFYESFFPKIETVKAQEYGPLKDPAFVEWIVEVEEQRAIWRDYMAEDLPRAMHCLAEIVLEDMEGEQSASQRACEARVRRLGELMHQLSLRYVVATTENSVLKGD